MLRAAIFVVLLTPLAGAAAAQAQLVGTVEELRTRADRLFSEERYDEARDAYLQIRGAFAKDPLLHRNLGTAYMRAATPDAREAIRYWTMSWQIDGNEDLRRETAHAYLTLGQWQQATRLLADLAEEHPHHPEHWREAAAAAEQAKQYEPAIDWYSRYLAHHPLDIATRVTRARLLGWERRFDEAIEEYIAVLKNAPRHRARIDYARVLSWSRRFDEAAREYQAVLSADPASVESRVGLAQIEAWQGRYDTALAQFNDVLAAAPDQREALIGRAQSLFWVGRRAEALSAFAALEARFPGDAEVADLAGRLRAAAHETAAPAPGDPAARRRAFEAALALDDKNADALRGLGELELAEGRAPEAIALYRRALSTRADPAIGLALARALARAKAYRDAAGAYEAVLTAEPDHLDARRELARLLSWDGRFDDALAAYGALLAQVPDDKDALVERARVLSWKGDLDRAIRQFTELEARYPGDRDVLLGKGQALQWAGRAREAERTLRPLSARYPDDRDIRVALAGTHLALGRGDLAWQEIEAAGGRSSDSADVQLMRSLVLRQIRPVLIIGYHPSVDSDDLRIDPWTATLYFSAVPRTRSYVRGSLTPARDPAVGNTEGRSTVVGSTVQLTPRVLLRGEAGLNLSAGQGRDAIGRFGATLLPSRRVRVDLDAERQFLDYLPRAVERHVFRDTVRTAVNLRPASRVLLRADYAYGRYSDDNRAHAGGLTATYAFANRERLMVDTGYLYTINTFADDPRNGYYAPSQIQRHAGLMNVAVRPARWIGWAFAGTLGMEQAVSDPYRLDGTARVSLDLSPTPALKWSVGYGYFRVASLTRSGAYLTHSVLTGVEVRF